MISAETLRVSLAAARTHLDDLQAEIEAGSRCAERIHLDVSLRDVREPRQHRENARFASLARYAVELAASIAEQRTILRELRALINDMRLALRLRRKAIAASVADVTREVRRAPEPGTARSSTPDKVRARSPRRPTQY